MLVWRQRVLALENLGTVGNVAIDRQGVDNAEGRLNAHHQNLRRKARNLARSQVDRADDNFSDQFLGRIAIDVL
jgi:hypothetical protein